MQHKLRQAAVAVGMALSMVAFVAACITVNLALQGNLDLTLPWSRPTEW